MSELEYLDCLLNHTSTPSIMNLLFFMITSVNDEEYREKLKLVRNLDWFPYDDMIKIAHCFSSFVSDTSYVGSSSCCPQMREKSRTATLPTFCVN